VASLFRSEQRPKPQPALGLLDNAESLAACWHKHYDLGRMSTKKRTLSFAFAAIACCILLFAFGIGFGIREGQYTSLVPNTGPLMNRINVIAPKFGHAPVRAATVATCKEVLQRLPSKIYALLEQGGATINLAPNIEDNWPGSGDGERPGSFDMTMGEEGGRCYGRDAWIYESEKVRGSHKLKPPCSQDEIRSTLYQILGHAINDSMGVLTKNEELEKLYNKDVDNMPYPCRLVYVEEIERNHDMRALGCSEIIGVLISGEDHHLFPITKTFPRATAYLKKQLLLD
jgi:hypothetical protein